MAGIDFTPVDSETSHVPRRFAPYKGYKSGEVGNFIFLFYLLLALFTALLIVKVLNRKKAVTVKAKKKVMSSWDAFAVICEKRGLTDHEKEVLAASLREIRTDNPRSLVASQNAFDRMAAAEVKRRVGVELCEAIHRKLFPQTSAPQTGDTPSGTRALQADQRLQIHFATVSGTFTCAILNMTADSFVISLPQKDGRYIRPQKDESVDGFMEIDNALFSFRSHVIETFTGGVFACRIAHTEGEVEVTAAPTTRIAVRHEIQFSHFLAGGAPGTQATGENRYIGSLRKLSLSGATIKTPANQRFEAGDYIQFTLPPHHEDPPFPITGTIVYVRPRSPMRGGGNVLHAEFVSLNAEAQAAITHAVR